MKILVLSDMHDDHRVIDRVRMLLSKRKFDAVFIAGDISNTGSVEFASELIEPLGNVYAVPGNMEKPPVIEFLEKSGHSIHNKKKKLEKYEVVGFGGNNRPGRMPFAFSDSEIIEALGKLGISRRTILLTHMPPIGCFDMVDGENLGSPAIRKIIEERAPFLSVSGHFHEHEGEQIVGETIVV
ncbi:MAG: metallophosphoesterase, partial [Candidatus Micrarchaeota archaeon]